jgi:hypothetical protein
MSDEPETRALTWRSVLFSLLGVLVIAGTAGFHDERMFGSTLVVGNHLPVAAFAYLFCVGLAWNGLAGRLNRNLALNSKELTVVMIVCLVSCFAPTSGLFRYFHRGIIMPWHYLSTGGRPEWEKYGLLDKLLSPNLFPQPVPYRDAAGVLQLDETVYRGFFTGLATGKDFVGLADVPFRAWTLPMLYWGPLVLLCALFCCALAFLVHRQWSQHEQLSYPIAQVAGGFCQRTDGGRGVPDVLRNRLFWAGFLPLFLIYLVEYLARWYPESLPKLSETLPAFRGWWVPLMQKLPILNKTPANWALSGQTIYFCVVGLAYFVSTEISLTMGLSSILLAVFGVWYYQIAGAPLTGDQMSLVRGGAYFGYALVLLYTGRSYYGAILARALGFRGKGAGGLVPKTGGLADDAMGILAARVLLVATAGFVATLVAMGSRLSMAIFFALLLLLVFLVMTRIVCETGVPFVSAEWWPGRMLVSLLGPAVIGPGTLVLLLWVSNALCIDPRECLMPYAATGTRLAQDARLRLRGAFGVVVAAVFLSVAVAFVAQHWTLYNLGPMADGTAASRFPQMHFNDAAKWMGEMSDQGVLDDSFNAKGLARLQLINPEPGAWTWILCSAAVVLLMSAVRFRFTAFPLHPTLLLVWGTYPCIAVWASFLLGWFVKSLVVRFGGGSVYLRLKPLFIGLIASEIMASALVIVVDMAHYWITGDVARVQIRILPG